MAILSKHQIKIPLAAKQFLKFGLVGLVNTLVTLFVIWVLIHWFHSNDYVANIFGYLAGLLNSFILNKIWTFQTSGNVKSSLVKFLIIFVISYFIQLGVLYLLLHFTKLHTYLMQVVSMISYTLVNFFLNKKYTFNNQ